MYSSVLHGHVHHPGRVHVTQFYSCVSLSPLHSVLLSYHYQYQTVHDTQSYSRSHISLSPLHSVSFSYHYDYQSQTVHDTQSYSQSHISVSTSQTYSYISLTSFKSQLFKLPFSSLSFFLEGGGGGVMGYVLQLGKRAHK